MFVELQEVSVLNTLDKTLLSVSKLMDSGVKIDFDSLILSFPNGSRVKIQRENGLFYVESAKSAYLTTKQTLTDKQKAHLRFGHMSNPYLDALVKQGLLTGLNYTSSDICFRDCKACNLGKLTRGHHKSLGNKRAAELGEEIYVIGLSTRYQATPATFMP